MTVLTSMHTLYSFCRGTDRYSDRHMPGEGQGWAWQHALHTLNGKPFLCEHQEPDEHNCS